MLSVEAMAMAKPVIAFVRDDVKKGFPPELPIAVATPDTVRDVLKELICHPELRHSLGKKIRKYVQKYHSVDSVNPELFRRNASTPEMRNTA